MCLCNMLVFGYIKAYLSFLHIYSDIVVTFGSKTSAFNGFRSISCYLSIETILPEAS